MLGGKYVQRHCRRICIGYYVALSSPSLLIVLQHDALASANHPHFSTHFLMACLGFSVNQQLSLVLSQHCRVVWASLAAGSNMGWPDVHAVSAFAHMKTHVKLFPV